MGEGGGRTRWEGHNPRPSLTLIVVGSVADLTRRGGGVFSTLGESWVGQVKWGGKGEGYFPSRVNTTAATVHCRWFVRTRRPSLLLLPPAGLVRMRRPPLLLLLLLCKEASPTGVAVTPCRYIEAHRCCCCCCFVRRRRPPGLSSPLAGISR